MAGVKKIKSSKKKSGRKKRSGGGGGFLKVLLVVIIVAVLAGGGFVFGPRLVHHCDNCGKLFFGTGYYPNVVTGTISQLTGQNEKILCAECAQKDHAIALAAGKSLKEFKRPMFPELEKEQDTSSSDDGGSTE